SSSVLLLSGGATAAAAVCAAALAVLVGRGSGRAHGLAQPRAARALEAGQRLVEAVERRQVLAVCARLGRLRLAELEEARRTQPVALPGEPQRLVRRLAVPLLEQRRPVRRHERAVGRLHLGPEPELGRAALVARIIGRSTRLLDLPLARKAREDRHAHPELRRERLAREAEREDVVALQNGRALRVRQRVARKTVGRGHGRREAAEDLVRLLAALELAGHLLLGLAQQVGTAARLARKARPGGGQIQRGQVLAAGHAHVGAPRRLARP